jgi:two-component sensor histidine kinase
MRLLIELLWPGAAPFAMVYPAVLIATLFARWQAGLLALVMVVVAGWYVVLPYRMSFVLANPGDEPRIAVNVIAGIAIIAVAELFRRAMRRTVAERDAQIAERDLLLHEIDHRVKNNFASVVSLLDLQRRSATDNVTREALAEALGRVESIARAHNALYRDAGNFGVVGLKPYAEELCGLLEKALFLRGSIRLDCDVAPVALSRDRVIAIGLLINELVTNSAKHAFAGRPSGTIGVAFHRNGGGYVLTVSDDGVGMPEPRPTASLGMRLVAAFARDAGGKVSIDSGADGTRVSIDLQA